MLMSKNGSGFVDPPRGEEYWTASSDEFQHAIDLIKYIRKTYHQEFCIGVAGNDCFPFPLTSIRADVHK